MDHITKSGKPIVGHNCFLDMLFLTQSFATDLEEKTYADFKKILLENFPAVYDTKYATNTLAPTLKETNLGILFSILFITSLIPFLVFLFFFPLSFS